MALKEALFVVAVGSILSTAIGWYVFYPVYSSQPYGPMTLQLILQYGAIGLASSAALIGVLAWERRSYSAF